MILGKTTGGLLWQDGFLIQADGVLPLSLTTKFLTKTVNSSENLMAIRFGMAVTLRKS